MGGTSGTAAPGSTLVVGASDNNFYAVSISVANAGNVTVNSNLVRCTAVNVASGGTATLNGTEGGWGPLVAWTVSGTLIAGGNSQVTYGSAAVNSGGSLALEGGTFEGPVAVNGGYMLVTNSSILDQAGDAYDLTVTSGGSLEINNGASSLHKP